MNDAGVIPDILLLNANTDAAMTERMVDQARRLHPKCRGATVADGARYITDRDSLQVAKHSVQQFMGGLSAAHYPDILIVACFGDPAVRDLRASLPFPIMGLAEASCEIACQTGNRFAIVTGGKKWPEILQEFVGEIGMASRLSGVYALEQTGDRIAKDRVEASTALEALVSEAQADGADVVIFGGAGLIGFAEELQAACKVPLLDSVDCAVRLATGLVVRSGTT